MLQDQFDYLDDDEEHDGFFKYKGYWYHVGEFMSLNSRVLDGPDDPFAKWDGYRGDSYFSGVVIKLSDDGEEYKVGTYLT